MPTRIDRREGDCLTVGGIPVAICMARGKKTVLIVGGYDGDGLLETEEDCKLKASRIREKIDKGKAVRDDSD